MNKDNNEGRENSLELRVGGYKEYYYFVGSYPSVFLELEGVSRVLGPDHPIVRLMEDANESLDEDELRAAQAAFDTLPKHVLDRIRHPWIGCPPPPGIHEKLSKRLIPKLVREVHGVEPVSCYLQIDARDAGDDHTLDTALVYDLREAKGWPVHVQIAEGSNKELVVKLLEKVVKTLEQDWDELIDPDLHLRLPEEPMNSRDW